MARVMAPAPLGGRAGEVYAFAVGEPGRLVGATQTSATEERPMTTENTFSQTLPVPTPAAKAAEPAVPAPAGWRWLLAAFLLAGAAQLITISALASADPLAVTWSSLLLAVAPAPLTAAAAFGPTPASRVAAVAALAALVAGIAGGIAHIGLWFLPALIALAVGAAARWRGRA
jgi:hypothetical protein